MTALSRLRAQVFSTEYFGLKVAVQSGSQLATRDLAPGLVEAIVEDTGGGERLGTWDGLGQPGWSHDELFGIARAQAAAKETEAVTAVIEGDIEVVISNGFYLSAHLLARFARATADVLFVPLSWHHWCVHPIGPMTVAASVAFLSHAAGRIGDMMTVTAAETLSRAVYWYRPDHRIDRVPIVGDTFDHPDLARLLAR